MWEKFFTDFSFMENPELSDLRQMAKKDEIPNRYGIPVYHSKIKSRSAKFTEYHYEITPDLETLFQEVFQHYQSRKWIKVERNIGSHRKTYSDSFILCHRNTHALPL